MERFVSHEEDGASIGNLVVPSPLVKAYVDGCVDPEVAFAEDLLVSKSMSGTSGILGVGFIDLPISGQEY